MVSILLLLSLIIEFFSVTWNVAFRYTDGYAMINKVQTLETESGNNRDCPEYAAAGILAGNISPYEYGYRTQTH